MTAQPFTATVTGSPRIGPKRELKRATEGYWAGRTSRSELESVAATLRREMWAGLAAAGLDSVPVNTFSYYDQMLDTAVMLGACRPAPGCPTIWTATSPPRAAIPTSRRWR